MMRLKALVDPGRPAQPGRLVNHDPHAHVKDLKSLPEVEEEVDRCIECGFCESHCPSRDLTLTPRQRIVVRREMAALAGARRRRAARPRSSTTRSTPARPTACAHSHARSGSTPASSRSACGPRRIRRPRIASRRGRPGTSGRPPGWSVAVSSSGTMSTPPRAVRQCRASRDSCVGCLAAASRSGLRRCRPGNAAPEDHGGRRLGSVFSVVHHAHVRRRP